MAHSTVDSSNGSQLGAYEAVLTGADFDSERLKTDVKEHHQHHGKERARHHVSLKRETSPGARTKAAATFSLPGNSEDVAKVVYISTSCMCLFLFV